MQLPEIQLGTKLSAAQTELQACEAHLANKERELEAFRTATIRSGLQVRCKALIECGWTWGEMGKEGLKALEMFEAPNGNGTSVCALRGGCSAALHPPPYARRTSGLAMSELG